MTDLGTRHTQSNPGLSRNRHTEKNTVIDPAILPKREGFTFAHTYLAKVLSSL